MLVRFTPPLISNKAIKRQPLTEKIERFSHRGLLYIHAPTGYGKTTAATMWLSAKKKNAVWFALDDYAATPVEFYRGLLIALNVEIDHDAFHSAPLAYSLKAVQSLHNSPEAVIIDNFHLCAGQTVAQALPLFLNRFPTETAFVILSRSAPDECLIDYRIKGILKQISMEDLQFGTEEVIELFANHRLSISEQDAAALQKQTGGWAAALSAILMSHNTEGRFSGILSHEALNAYLRSYVCADEKDYDIFKKCSVSDRLSRKLCTAITEQTDAWDAILNLSAKTGLITKINPNRYRFHTLLRGFLEAEMIADKAIDKPRIYRNAADWYLCNGELFRALDMAAKSGNIHIIEEYTRHSKQVYGKYSSDIDNFITMEKDRILSLFPEAMIAGSLFLSMECTLSTFYCGELAKAFQWFDIVKGHLVSGKPHTKTEIFMATLHSTLDPRESVWDIPDKFGAIASLWDNACFDDAIPAFSMTGNLPFFHRAQNDYGDISPRLDAFAVKVEQYVQPMLGPLCEPLLALLKAGIYYERAELQKAETIAEAAIRTATQFTPEIMFSALALYAEILRVQGKNTQHVADRIEEMIHTTKATYLTPNFLSFRTTTALYSGSVSAANAWLAQVKDSSIRLNRIVQHITTVRALLVIGNFAEASTLLEAIIRLAQDFRRSTDYIEALTLLSVCRWRQKQTDLSVMSLKEAIAVAKSLEIVMPIMKEGVDILPVLQKIIKTSSNRDTSFEFKLYLLIKEHKMNKGMFYNHHKKPVRLSKQQLRVLSVLAQNYTYAQIAAEMNISLNTVHAHQKTIYTKLDVRCKMDAVLRARELKLI